MLQRIDLDLLGTLSPVKGNPDLLLLVLGKALPDPGHGLQVEATVCGAPAACLQVSKGLLEVTLPPTGPRDQLTLKIGGQTWGMLLNPRPFTSAGALLGAPPPSVSVVTWNVAVRNAFPPDTVRLPPPSPYLMMLPDVPTAPPPGAAQTSASAPPAQGQEVILAAVRPKDRRHILQVLSSGFSHHQGGNLRLTVDGVPTAFTLVNDQLLEVALPELPGQRLLFLEHGEHERSHLVVDPSNTLVYGNPLELRQALVSALLAQAWLRVVDLAFNLPER